MPLLAGEYRVVAQNESRQTPIALDALWAAATPVTLADDQTVALTLGAQKRP